MNINTTHQKSIYKLLQTIGTIIPLIDLGLLIFWDDHLKNRGENDIFNDFEFFTLSLEFQNFYQKIFHTKDNKKFQEFFEKPLIKNLAHQLMLMTIKMIRNLDYS